MLKSKRNTICILATNLLLGTLVINPTPAAEPGTINYPAGSPGPFLGKFPPIPGLFAVAQTSYTSADALYDKDGDKIHADDFQLDIWVQTFRFVASYPWQLGGANLYSQFVLPLVFDVHSSLSVDTPYGKFDLFDGHDAGLSNLVVSPLIMNWQEKDSPHYFTLGLDIILAAGASYDEDNAVNAGTGYTTYMPIAAYRYDKPNGLDAGIKVNYLFNRKNGDTDYHTGDMIAIESIVGWNFGNWKVSTLANYTDQLEDDKIGGAKQKDSQYRYMNVGPSITFSAGPMIFNLNCQFGVLAENTSMNNSFWFNFTVPLYVPNASMQQRP
ncbi:MAG: transporter [Desulfopila sp.]